ncbi:ATP-binding protein [Ruminococcus sp. Marseille-P6503]|uniref:ATP-binding protein n=1 Tax=Ruminococcus sp. Marseille-P6503 TaxID=2364796 RepID=UPI000F529AF5|nr:ATP-binding protein [Ruminococcus sp. Marseille-P6503]
MKYSEQAFERAEAELSRRRKRAEEIHIKRTEEINRIAPEIAVLQRSLSNTGAELMKLVMEKREDTAEIIEKVKEKNLRTQETIKDMLQVVKGDRNYLDVPYSCAICGDTGYSGGARCECLKGLLKKYTIEEINSNCHIKLHDFTEFRLEYYDNTSINGAVPREKMAQNYQFCRDYALNFGKGSPSLFFFGRTGLGKTFLSSCIAKQLTENGFNVAFGSILDFLRAVENERFGRAEGDTLEILINADLLILDDLGSEFQTAFNESALYDIINSRINLDRPTIISTNLSASELNGRYNERIVSRITGCFDPIPFIGKDIRHVKRQFKY